VTPLYPQTLALTSPTGGGRSVGIVGSRTKAMEFSFSGGFGESFFNTVDFGGLELENDKNIFFYGCLCAFLLATLLQVTKYVPKKRNTH
jgi:hypothetical protein